MADKEKQKYEQKEQEKEAAAAKKKAFLAQREESEVLVRIMGFDIPGSRNIYAGLTRIKGISWAISNAACIKLGYQRTKKISELSKDEVKKIEGFLRGIQIYDFMKNRRNDEETGKTEHLFGSDIDVKKEFDIKRLKGIKSYRGIRHALKQPVRGQRTRSHFRTKKRAMGVKKK